MFTGLPVVGLTLVPGIKLHVELAIAALQEMLTLWSNDPAALTWNSTGDDVVPRGTVTVDGEGVLSAKLTTCKVRAASRVTLCGSDPTPCMLKLYTPVVPATVTVNETFVPGITFEGEIVQVLGG